MKKVSVFISSLSLSILLVSGYPASQLVIHDFLKLTNYNSPQFSPDGKWITFSMGEREQWDGLRITNLWLSTPDGKDQRRLTNSQKTDNNPQWSPDGSQIAFLSNRTDKTQIFVISPSGGESRQVTFSTEDVQSFDWYDKETIAYICNAPRDTAVVAKEETAGGGYEAGGKARKSILSTQSIIEKSKKRQITQGDYFIAAMDASSDGKYFVLQVSEDSDLFKQGVEGRILVVNIDGKEVYRFDKAESFSNPTFAPSNQHIAFIGNTVGYSANNALFVSDLKSQKTWILTEKFDPTIESMCWMNENTIVFKTPRHVYSGLYQVTLDGKIAAMLEPYWVINDFSIHTQSKQIAFTGSRSQQPIEVFSSKWYEPAVQAKMLTNNNGWIKEKAKSTSQIVQFPAKDGMTIESVINLPPDYKSDIKYPIMVLPHGGPDGVDMDQFSLWGQLFAVAGFIVYQPNFRGSIGYGVDFYKANRGKLGYIDYEDIMAGLNYLIARGMVDTTRMVVGGWSYGGYMTNWIIGHSNRFKAAVSVAGIANTVSMYAQSDINHGEIARWEFLGVPVTDMENFIRSSPMTYLKNCTTPTLIMHGEADERVPVYQAWELYRALDDLGVETKLVLYPGAAHGIRAPKQFADVITRWIEWYHRFLK